mgnify:FL=1
MTADYVTEQSQVKPLLECQIYSPVRWQQTIERMLADGVDEFVEIGPGRTLTGFLKKINPNVSCVSIDKLEDFEKYIETQGR